MRTATRGGVDRSHSSLRTLDCGAIDLIAQVMYYYYAARRSSYTEQEHSWRAADRPVVVSNSASLHGYNDTEKKARDPHRYLYASNACDPK